jgi:hypothetical protein
VTGLLIPACFFVCCLFCSHQSLEQPDVTVDSGSYVKEKVLMGSGAVSYPVTTVSNSGNYSDVVIEYSQYCAGASSCQVANVTFSGVLPAGVTVTTEAGRIVLTGDYTAINEAMQNLIISPGAGNPNPIDVMITATDETGTASDFDSFTIPIDSVSCFMHIFHGWHCFICLFVWI